MKNPRILSYAALAMVLGVSATPSIGQATSGLRSSSALVEDEGKHDSWTYRNPDIPLTKYQSFLILPTVVTTDPTAKWGKSDAAARQKYAQYMTTALRTEIGKTYQIADKPGDGVGALQLTLLGVQDTVPLVATASRFSPMGLAVNGIQSLRGKKGSMTGSVQVALEMADSKSNALVFAAVRQRSPNALDIESTLSTEKTVEAVANDIAETVRKGIDKANGR